MNQILLMQNPIQPYAWGSHSAIAELLGEQVPSEQPQAELWMGAHPKSPSRVWYQERWQPLDQIIARNAKEILGVRVLKKFSHRLPYLFKVLAADQPLSIQAHPDKNQAQEGFNRENNAGIALDASHRNYKDDQHKPECICALTPFLGMCGFRQAAAIRSLTVPIWPLQHDNALKMLENNLDAIGLRDFFTYLMKLDSDTCRALIDHVIAKATIKREHDIAYEWILRLNERYPYDIGVLSPLMLNMIHLRPGQALFLPARQLHAYLEGLGIELMANSDNVLRGGLTPKHVDVSELLKVIDFKPYIAQILLPQDFGSPEKMYSSRAEEFALSVIDLSDSKPFVSSKVSPGPAILFCTQGEATLSWTQSENEMVIMKGQSVFIPDSVTTYTLKGDAEFYKACVNI
jgi:mannose-6-phosphate isomerase